MRITSGGNVIVGNAAYAGTTTDLSITGDKVNSDGFYSRLIFQNSNQSGGSSASIRGERVTSNFATELTFYTNPTGSIGSGTERMRITSGGRVLIGVTTNAAGGALAVASNGVVVYDGANYRQMYQSSSAMYWFNGSNEAYLSSAGVWTNASDISIKKDINDIKYGLNEVMKLKPKSYKMIDDDLEQIGFIAQDVE
jgi:hypothetical protein